MTCETVQSAQNSSAMLPSPGWPFVIPPEQELASARKQAAAEGRADARAAAERMKEQLADLQSRGTAPRMNWFLGGPGLRT
jgi:hypothetical protein